MSLFLVFMFNSLTIHLILLSYKTKYLHKILNSLQKTIRLFSNSDSDRFLAFVGHSEFTNIKAIAIRLRLRRWSDEQ